MKKLAAIVCLSALSFGAFAQGLVTFANNPTTLVSSAGTGGNSINSGAGTYYFALLTSATAAGPFTFSGSYGTNLAVAGRLTGGPNTGIPVAGWAPGTAMSFEVAGWSASLGTTWNAGWVNADGSAKPGGDAIWSAPGFFGTSAIATGTAGGGPQSLPPQPIFGSVGVAGFSLSPVGAVPEPGTMALAGLGAAALLIFRRRK